MVEPPGTAPGSDPLILCAFMPIVRVAPDRDNIGGGEGRHKGAARIGERAGQRALPIGPRWVCPKPSGVFSP